MLLVNTDIFHKVNENVLLDITNCYKWVLPPVIRVTTNLKPSHIAFEAE